MIWNILLSFFSAVIGASATLLFPGLVWSLQKRKRKYFNRKVMLKNVRELLTKDFDSREFCSKQVYSQLRPYLSKGIIKELEMHSEYVDIVVGHYRSGIVPKLLDELSLLERRWLLL